MAKMTLGEAIDLVVKKMDGEVVGQCYAASEAVYHLVGGKDAGLTPMYMKLPLKYKYITHWFLRGRHGEIIDLTAGQFPGVLNYSKAVGCGFRGSDPSYRAQKLMEN